MASTEGRYAALGGESSTSQARRFPKRLRGEGVSTSTKAGPASAQKKTHVQEVQHETEPSSARKKTSVEEGQSNKGERDIIITRQHFPAHPPEHAPFENQRDYEQYVRPYLGLKVKATDELDASARKWGYKDYVDSHCFQLVDV
jgi:hypothetical protein